MISRRSALGAAVGGLGPLAVVTADRASQGMWGIAAGPAPTQAPPPSGGDDLAALRAAMPRLGSLMLGTGTYRLSGTLTLGEGQDLYGMGGNFAGAATVVRATAPAGGVRVTETGSLTGNLLIDGAGIATAPFVRALGNRGAMRTFLNLSVVGSARDNMLVTGAQNDTWIGCNTQEAARDLLVLDQGAGGHAFLRCEFNAAGRFHLRSDRQIPGGLYVVPTDNTFDHCIFERENTRTGTATSCAALLAFDALVFTACTFFAGAASTGPRIDVASSGSVTLISGRVLGVSATTGGTGMRVANGAHVVLAAQPRFENLAGGIELVSGNPTVEVLGNVVWNNVGRRYLGAGSQDVSVVLPVDHPVRITRDAATDTALTVGRAGENGIRLALGANGAVGFNNGVGYAPKASLFSGAPGVLSMPPNQTLQTGRGPRTGRPAAGAVGSGAQFYDTTLHRPIWSDGSVWKDAQGNSV